MERIGAVVDEREVAEALVEVFEVPDAMLQSDPTPADLARAITSGFSDAEAAEHLRPVVERLIDAGRRFADESELSEEVPESIYVMY